MRGRRAHIDKTPELETVTEANAKEPTLLNIEGLIRAQAGDRLCRMFHDTVEMPSSEYSIDSKSI